MVKTAYKGTNSNLIAYKGDHEPIKIAVGGTVVDNLSYTEKTAEGTTSVAYQSEYKKNLLGMEIQGNSTQPSAAIFDVSSATEYCGISSDIDSYYDPESERGGWTISVISFKPGALLDGETLGMGLFLPLPKAWQGEGVSFELVRKNEGELASDIDLYLGYGVTGGAVAVYDGLTPLLVDGKSTSLTTDGATEYNYLVITDLMQDVGTDNPNSSGRIPGPADLKLFSNDYMLVVKREVDKPSIDYPIEITNAGDNGLAVELKGKNLVNIKDRTVIVENRSFPLQHMSAGFVVEPSTTYTFAFDYEFKTEPTSTDSSLKLRIAAYTGVSAPNGSYRSGGKAFPDYNEGRLVYNFTTKANLGDNVNLFFRIPEEDQKFTTKVDIKNCILVKGNYTELPYEPYVEPQAINIPNEVTLADGTIVPIIFAKCGNYADVLTVDTADGKVTYTQNVFTKVFTSDDFSDTKWDTMSGYNNVLMAYFTALNLPYPVKGIASDITGVMCNYLIESVGAPTSVQGVKHVWDGTVNMTPWLLINVGESDKTSSLDKLKSLSDFTIQYVLNEPIVSNITGSDLANNLLEWAKKTFNGTNVIEVTSDTLPVSKLSVNYAKWGGANQLVNSQL